MYSVCMLSHLQLCLTLCGPMNCSLPGSSVHGILQARILDWVGDPGRLHYLVAQLVKNLPAMRETWVQSMGWEDPLEKGKATHSRVLAWRIPWAV